jgi:hypothetical protein
MDLRRFAIRMKTVGKGVQSNADVMTKKVALATDASVVISTPVDTGRARSNWVAEIGAPASGVVEPYALNNPSGSAQAAIAQAQAVVGGYKTGQEIHITNNLDYIGKLNEGWSAQAPAGFVQSAVLNGIAQVESVKLVN